MTAPSPDTGPTLAVIVVNYGSHDLVETNLQASLGPTFTGHVVVVDNFAGTQDRDAMAAICASRGWTFVGSPENRGFGGGNNLGVDRAIELGCAEFLFLNPDAQITVESIEGLHRRVIDDPLLLVAPRVLRADGTLFSDLVDLQVEDGRMRAAADRPAGVDPSRIHPWVSGACFMLTRRLWEAIGGFDESYFLYWEDVDLCRRAVLAGGRVEVDPESQAVHDEGQTHGYTGPRRAKSPLYYRFNTRNRLVYAAKHLAPRDRRRWLLATPAASYAILLQGGRRQFVRPHRSLWPALRGTIAGFWLYRRILRAGRPELTGQDGE